ncbi:glycosyltransferase, partial [Candidatus Dojkabacteria bacterium]|nr:glycosyltransferase [Candidatus Dojkabacteria bacterium]
GFGFSLAEAITMRVPIVASNASVYPEIVKDTSLLVDPENIEAIADMINKQLIDRKKTSLNIDISWEKVANRVYRALEKNLK